VSRTGLPAADRERRLAEAHNLLVTAVGRLASTQDWLTMLDVSSRLPNYSANNCLLLMVQGAEGMVMGYHAWRRVPARGGGYCQVRRGAKGLAILAPVTRTVGGQATPEPGGIAGRGDEPDGAAPKVRRLVGFRVAHVFDQRALVSPPELPDVRPRMLQGQSPAQLWKALAGEVATAGYRLHDDLRIAPANGQTHFADRTVAVRPDLPAAQRVKTLAHELAHVLLHQPDTLPKQISRAVAEVEAESVAYLVVGELGLDSTAYTFPYITDWSTGDTDLVLATTNRAIAGARQILDQLSRTLTLPVPSADVTELPPAPTPLVGAGPALSILDEAPQSAGRVRIDSRSGHWELGWDPPLGTFFGRHNAAGGAPDTEPQTRFGTYAGAVATLGELEQHLGFALPGAVREHLAAGQQAHPARRLRAFTFLDTDDRSRDWSAQTQPAPDSPVHIPGRPEGTYQRAIRAEPPLRAWEEDGYRVEILAATPFDDPDTGGVRQTVDYRLSHNGRMIFSGDDIECPGHVDPASDEAVRAVAELLTLSTSEPTNPVHRAFLDNHAELLTAYLQPPDPPYPEGTRVVRDERGRATTGTITEPVTSPDGELIAYAWRPDHADLPGHPWQHQPWQAVLIPPGQLRPTLAAPDLGVTGWTPDTPLAHGATVTVGADQAGSRMTGRVVRAFADPGGLSYQVQPDDPIEPPVRASAADIDPVAGTAWPSIGHLTAARAKAGVPLQPGEVLTAGSHCAWVIAGPAGPTLVDTPPSAVIDAPAHTPAALDLGSAV